jgi:hypothetical protein
MIAVKREKVAALLSPKSPSALRDRAYWRCLGLAWTASCVVAAEYILFTTTLEIGNYGVTTA